MGKRFRNKNNGSKGKSINEGKGVELTTKYTRSAINNYEDVELNEVDAFHAGKDKVYLDNQEEDDEEGYENPDRYQDEVFALGVDEEEEEDYEQEHDEEEEEEEEEGYVDEKNEWGGKKQNYYDGEEIEEEDDAKLEEEEALKLQRKRIANLKESDFLDQVPGLLTGKAIVKDDQEDLKLVQDLDKELDNLDTQFEVVPKAKRQNLNPEEAKALLEKESPEIPPMMEQLEEIWHTVNTEMLPLAKRIQRLDKEVVFKAPILAHFYLKYETYLSYLNNVAFYLHLKAKETSHLQDHPVVETLVRLTSIFNRLDEAEEEINLNEMVEEALTSIENGTFQFENGNLEEEVIDDDQDEPIDIHKPEGLLNLDKDVDQDDEVSEISEDLQEHDSGSEVISSEPELDGEEEQTFAEMKRSLSKAQAKYPSIPQVKGSDYQDVEYMEADEAADKAHKKHTLRHHAALIHQTTMKRTRQVKLAGDADIPYKNKDHGKTKGPVNRAINEEANDADIFDDDEVTAPTQDSKEPKLKKSKTLTLAEQKARLESWATFNPDEQETSQKRVASYRILANKGLAPKRKKEQRNPRVKHRKKFETAAKKLSSTKKIYKPQTSGYGGEATGIKTHLTRSTKFT